MGALWSAVAPRLKRHRRALAHLALAFPEKSPQERELLAREMWGHLGRTFAEFFHIDEIFAQGRVVMESQEKLRWCRTADPTSSARCTWAIGSCWRGSPARLARPLAGVYQPLTNRKVDEALSGCARRCIRWACFRARRRRLRKLMKIAKDGGSVGFMSDLREGKGVAVPFFGRPAHSNTAPALIARAYGLKLYAVRVIRQPGVRFTVRVEPVEVPVTDDRDADVAAATAKIHARFEEFLREAPGQWMWAHRRWD